MPSAANEPELMRIGKAAEAAGVSKQTIEYYVLVGLIHPIRLPDRRSRYFDRELIKRIRLIRRLNRSGYTLRAIREMWLRKK